MIEDLVGTVVAGIVRLLMGVGTVAGLAFITVVPVPVTSPVVPPPAGTELLTVSDGEIRSGVLAVSNADYTAGLFRTAELFRTVDVTNQNGRGLQA